MLRKAVLWGVWACATIGLAQEASCKLPQPRFDRKASDPSWLQYVVQFHGHLGPSVIAGARLGMAGIHAVAAEGYFDVEVTCEGPFAKPPQSCFLDGLQVATGATLGKRTLHWVEAEQILVRVRNTRTGKTVELQPTPRLLGLLSTLPPRAKMLRQKPGKDHSQETTEEERVEAIARRIALMPDEEILTASFSK